MQTTSVAFAQRQMENLTRGTVAVRQTDGVYVGWRLLGTDPEGIEFNVYRQVGDSERIRLNDEPISGATNLVDRDAPRDGGLSYTVVPVVDSQELNSTVAANVWEQSYLEFPIQPIDDYRPGDASVADLDGDGQLDIVLHQTSRGRDNGSAGVTGTPILDGYKFDGTHLWRIDLGKNVREGEHYTQFMVYDLDGDGRAELVCKTADGTVDGQGKVIGDAEKDWRTLDEGSQRHGRILDGPEYLTVFDGLTGKALQTVDYIPSRLPINGWGGIGGNAGNDNYGNRCDRFLACVAYLDGRRPSVVMCRGVYGRIVMAAWDWRDGELSVRWVFDSGMSYPPYANASPFSGMGGHSLSVADVDDDGKDEIIYQAMVIDDNGKGLYSTGLRHGDAMYITDMYPNRDGMEVFTIQENENDAELFQTPGAAMRDARTGEILWSHSPVIDVGSGMAADIDPRYLGYEAWGGPGGLRNSEGESIGPAPRETGWSVWWDGDPLRELLSPGRPERSRTPQRGSAAREARGNAEPRPNIEQLRGPREDRDEQDTQARSRFRETELPDQQQNRELLRRRFGPQPTRISKWNWNTEEMDPLVELDGVSFSRGPSIMGDLIGDWREEILLASPDGKSLRLYTTTIPTDLRLPTLLHDPQYRLGLAWQNVVYNKPCYPSYYLGDGMKTPTRPHLNLVGKGEAIELKTAIIK
ncbi:rhamnogalacturonan lyase [Bythopirellula goksoeyrii]|nr:rhamnogalacturonan lyase [Bythopirellula goksoeyrii]